MTDYSPLRDYTRSRAVLLGTSYYTCLSPALPAGNSLTRMADLLTGPLCGWPAAQVTVVRNERRPGDLPDRLVSLFVDISDVALFYYVGHGQVDDRDQLCLGLVDSRTEPHRRHTTSLSFEAVRNALLRSPAATKILILDCCFSGLATRVANTLGDDVLDRTGGTGAYTMAASSRYSTAWFETDPRIPIPHTYFTKYLADLVEAGIPGQPAKLKLDPVFTRLRENLARDRLPVPHARNIDAAHDFIFARNAAPPETQVDPDAELAWLRKRLGEAAAREHQLEAEVAKLTRERQRLRDQARDPRQLTMDENRRIQAELREVVDRLDETAEARSTAQAERRKAVDALERVVAEPDGRPTRPTSTSIASVPTGPFGENDPGGTGASRNGPSTFLPPATGRSKTVGGVRADRSQRRRNAAAVMLLLVTIAVAACAAWILATADQGTVVPPWQASPGALSEFAEAVYRFPTVVFSLSAVAVIVYMVFVWLGGITSRPPDATHAGPDGGGFAGFFGRIGLGGVPIFVVLSSMIAITWFLTFTGTDLFERDDASPRAEGVLWAGVLVVALACAWLGTRLLVLVLCWLFSKREPSRRDFLGTECVIRTSRVGPDFGQAWVTAADGSSSLVQVRHAGGGPLQAGSTALIYAYDDEGEFFLVRPVGTAAPGPDRPIRQTFD